MAKKALWGLWSAGGATLRFGARTLVNSGATKYVLPPILRKVLPIHQEMAEAACEAIDSGLQRLLPEADGDPPPDLPGYSPESLINKVTLKTMAKVAKAEKFDQIFDPYLKIITNAKLTLQENAQNFADEVAEETKQFEQAHPEFKEALAQLRNQVKNYTPPADQTELDPDILGILIAPKIMSQIPYLPQDPNDPNYIPPTGIFKPESKLQRFDEALPDILSRAEKLEIENPDDVGIFHRRWRNLQLSDEMPFILIGGKGATEGDGAIDLAREWCKKVDEIPMEIGADDLVERLTGTRPKDAMPRLGPEDPLPMKQLGGFYSRVNSGNPTSPMIIKGFDSKNPDHAILIPLLEDSNEISIPYKGIPGVFRFNTRGMAVFLCEDDAFAGRTRKLEVPAGDTMSDKPADGEQVKNKAKGKEKEKGKSPGEEKAKDKAKDKGKDKGKEKGPDGERMKNLGVERLKAIPRATFKEPSEKRRTEKLEEVLGTKVHAQLGTIFRGESDAARELKDAVEKTTGSDEYKTLIVKKSMECKTPLKETEKLALYMAEYVAAQYQTGVMKIRLTENPLRSRAGASSRDAGNQVDAFMSSNAKKEIDKNIGKFIENYFKRFEEEDVSKPKDQDVEKKADPSLPPAWTKNVDTEAMLAAFPMPISAQGKQPLPRGQTTLDRFFKPKELSPLLEAAKRGDMTALESLLGNPQAELKETDADGNGPLHLAVMNDKPDAVRALLGHPNVNINARNGAGRTVFHIAMEKGRQELVDLLVEKVDAIVQLGEQTRGNADRSSPQ